MERLAAAKIQQLSLMLDDKQHQLTSTTESMQHSLRQAEARNVQMQEACYSNFCYLGPFLVILGPFQLILSTSSMTYT